MARSLPIPPVIDCSNDAQPTFPLSGHLSNGGGISRTDGAPAVETLILSFTLRASFSISTSLRCCHWGERIGIRGGDLGVQLAGHAQQLVGIGHE